MNLIQIKNELNAKVLEFFVSPKLGEDGKPLVDEKGKKVPSGFNRAKTTQGDFIIIHDELLASLKENPSQEGLFLKRKPEVIFTDDKGREEICRVFVLCHSDAEAVGTL